MQEYQKPSSISICDVLKLPNGPKIGEMMNIKLSLGTTGLWNWLMTGNPSKNLPKRPKDCFLMTKYKKSLQKIKDLGTLWTGSKGINY